MKSGLPQLHSKYPKNNYLILSFVLFQIYTYAHSYRVYSKPKLSNTFCENCMVGE